MFETADEVNRLIAADTIRFAAKHGVAANDFIIRLLIDLDPSPTTLTCLPELYKRNMESKDYYIPKSYTTMSIKGHLPHHTVKAIVFWILTVCVVAATASGILHSWGTIAKEIANSCLWTAFILSLGSIAFLLINCLFGDLGQSIFASEAPKPNIDPAFRERLKASKVPPPHEG